jgi:hypothetical protein
MGQLSSPAGGWRQDTNLRGVIRTEDGVEILVSVHGQSVQEETPSGVGRAILARVELLSEVGGNYSWLNTSFIVGEGEIDEETTNGGSRPTSASMKWSPTPPGIGDMPPERFRPTGS